jgi:hypothetical protein
VTNRNSLVIRKTFLCAGRRHALWYIGFFVGISLLGTCDNTRSQSQMSTGADSIEEILPTPEVSQYWQVREAGLIEQVSGTNGFLMVENVSVTSLNRGTLYAEYFTSDDRFCFSLMYSLERNEGDRTPVPPGGKRTIFSAASGLLPLMRPTRARIYLVAESKFDESGGRADQVSVRVPATLNSTVPSANGTLRVPPDIVPDKGSFVDLVLATVTVSDSGEVIKTNVINAKNPDLAKWFLGFVDNLTFYPATEAGKPVASTALIDVFAILSKQASPSSFSRASERPWIRQYLEHAASNQASPVTQILFGPPSTKIKFKGQSEYTERPESPLGLVELISIGSDWSSPNYEWVKDESMPQHQARKLIEISSP